MITLQQKNKQHTGPQAPEGREGSVGRRSRAPEEFRRAGDRGEEMLAAKILALARENHEEDKVVRRAQLTVIIACLDPKYASEASVEKAERLAKAVFEEPGNYRLIFDIYAEDPERFGPAILKQMGKREEIAFPIVEECAREFRAKLKVEQRRDARALLERKLALEELSIKEWERGL
ncbi:Uncharacterised protein [uncultured archaeon]|nr:Uncharacterised protein [uncultured archaeon]